MNQSRLWRGVSVLALSAAAATQVTAQDFDDVDAVIILGANFEEVEAERTGVTVSVVTEEELQATEETRVIDYLARVPGVALRTTGPIGTQASVFIRGINQNDIAVRVDGIDVSDPSGPQVAFDFGGLTTADISRIEVIRGSHSAVYGSEAIGGVINITTRRAIEPGMAQEAALEYGAYNTVRGAYSLTNRGARHDLAFTLSHVQSDGFSAADENDGNSEDDGFEATRLSFAGSYQVSDAVVLSLFGFTETAEFDYDEASGGLVFDGTPDDVTERDQSGLRALVEVTGDRIDHQFEVSRFQIERTNRGTNSFGPFEFNYEGTRTTFGYRGATDITPATRLVFGAEQVEETYADASSFGSQDHDTSVTAAYGEVSYAATDRVDLTATLRYDSHSEFGEFVTGRLAGVWRVRDDLILRSSLANGFRAPSNYELYDGFAGNPDLDPETSLSFDIGIEKRYGDAGHVAATLFAIEAEDIIDYSFDTFAYVQRPGTVRRTGLELEAGWSFANDVTVTAAYTYTESDTDGVTLDSSGWASAVPRHAISAALSAPIGERLRLDLVGLFEGDREGLDDYAVAHGTLTYALSDRAEAYVRIENLFDEEYQTVPGYGTSDRALFAGLRASF